MSAVEQYLSRVGVQTGNAMKLALFDLLASRYRNAYEGDFPDMLAASVVNGLFCEAAADPELRMFAEQNGALVESKTKELANEESVCRSVTDALYNFCYGKYIDAGGKVGMLSHPFLGYVRALQQVVGGKEPISFLESFKSKVGSASAEPLFNLWLLGIYRCLPYTPDSKLMMDGVASFARSVKASVLK